MFIRTRAQHERPVSVHRAMPIRRQDGIMSRLPAYSVRMQGMEKIEAVPATRDIAGASEARGKACPIDLGACSNSHGLRPHYTTSGSPTRMRKPSHESAARAFFDRKAGNRRAL